MKHNLYTFSIFFEGQCPPPGIDVFRFSVPPSAGDEVCIHQYSYEIIKITHSGGGIIEPQASVTLRLIGKTPDQRG